MLARNARKTPPFISRLPLSARRADACQWRPFGPPPEAVAKQSLTSRPARQTRSREMQNNM